MTTADVWMSQLGRESTCALVREAVPADSSDLECIFPRLLWVLQSQAGSMPGVPQGSLFSPSKNGREGSANAVFQIYQTILTSRVSHHSFFFSKEMKAFPDH